MFQCIPIIDFSTLSRHWSLSSDYTQQQQNYNALSSVCGIHTKNLIQTMPIFDYTFVMVHSSSPSALSTLTYLFAWRYELLASRGPLSIDIWPNCPLQGTIPMKWLCCYYLLFDAIYQPYHGVTFQLNKKLLVGVLEEINLKKHELLTWIEKKEKKTIFWKWQTTNYIVF